MRASSASTLPFCQSKTQTKGAGTRYLMLHNSVAQASSDRFYFEDPGWHPSAQHKL
jgi:hypothetical protein